MSGFARGQKVWVEAEFVDDYRPNTDDVEVRVRWSDGVAQLIDVGVSTISTTPPIPVGEVPPWMEKAPTWVEQLLTSACGHGRRLVEAPGGIYAGQLVHRTGGLPCDTPEPLVKLYRIATPSDSPSKEEEA